jgi:hypothetical protein
LNLGTFPEGIDVATEIEKAAKTGRSKGTEVTGLWVMAPETGIYFDLDLTASNYVALCLLPDPPEQGPHALKGMWTEFTVR